MSTPTWPIFPDACSTWCPAHIGVQPAAIQVQLADLPDPDDDEEPADEATS